MTIVHWIIIGTAAVIYLYPLGYAFWLMTTDIPGFSMSTTWRYIGKPLSTAGIWNGPTPGTLPLRGRLVEDHLFYLFMTMVLWLPRFMLNLFFLSFIVVPYKLYERWADPPESLFRKS